ncbi:MAG: hypothetical protein O3A29_09310 [Planctomycetota bacterium]|nr:hypothetical protein [Planctomycetota bacterium]
MYIIFDQGVHFSKLNVNDPFVYVLFSGMNNSLDLERRQPDFPTVVFGDLADIRNRCRCRHSILSRRLIPEELTDVLDIFYCMISFGVVKKAPMIALLHRFEGEGLSFQFIRRDIPLRIGEPMFVVLEFMDKLVPRGVWPE